MVPRRRANEAAHEVTAFKSVRAAVALTLRILIPMRRIKIYAQSAQIYSPTKTD